MGNIIRNVIAIGSIILLIIYFIYGGSGMLKMVENITPVIIPLIFIAVWVFAAFKGKNKKGTSGSKRPIDLIIANLKKAAEEQKNKKNL